MPDPEQVRMSGLITYLRDILSRRFSARVSRVYFGDIGRYPPAVFGSSRSTQKAVIAINPVYNALEEGQRVAAFENREYGLQILVLMNLTPFFDANPEEAFAERVLTELADEISTYLTQQENVTLGGRVKWSTVGDTDYAWLKRENQYLRAAAIGYTARVRINRADPTP